MVKIGYHKSTGEWVEIEVVLDDFFIWRGGEWRPMGTRALLEAKSEYSMQGYGGLPLSELDKARWEFELELALEEYKWVRSEIERISTKIRESIEM